jgi:hypothetical protein
MPRDPLNTTLRVRCVFSLNTESWNTEYIESSCLRRAMYCLNETVPER